ncbi:MAG: biotin--[acetyl-CoA-carboxylase] ligase, partial [Nitrososphaera sp.]|nr:biotin--[acetyl-CoA-carboxylase] ligase [Nitrososphaera sp.]
LAEEQSMGRGRLKRKWMSPRGGIWMSVVLEPEIPTSMINILSFVAAIAVCDAIRERTKLDAKLKWPNDVMISGRKVAGILLDISAEAERVNHVVIGIGVNANVDPSIITEDFREAQPVAKITSLRNELGDDVDRLQLAKSILENLEKTLMRLNVGGRLPIIEAWKKETDMMGRKVQVFQENRIISQGIAIDIGVDGSLLLKSHDGNTTTVTSGDVKVRY